MPSDLVVMKRSSGAKVVPAGKLAWSARAHVGFHRALTNEIASLGHEITRPPCPLMGGPCARMGILFKNSLLR